MRHLYECPMRWADLDLLGHVNNVVHVDYLQEARVDMLRAHGRRTDAGLEEGVVVVRHEVTYLAPLSFRFRPVLVECWVTEVRAASFTLAYEVFHEEEDPERPGSTTRRVYARARTVLTPFLFAEERPRRLTAEERAHLAQYLEPEQRQVPPAPVVPRTDAGHHAVQVRFSDVDVYGHVNNVKYFEYLQEARIRLIGRLWRGAPEGTPRTALVVAQTDVDYKAPILHRAEPYDCWTTVERVGTRSLTFASELRDGERLLARARVVAVFFDTETQRAAEPPAFHRERLLAFAGQG